MTQTLNLKDYCITISYSALEPAWQKLAAPGKRHLIPEMIDTLRTRNKSEGASVAVYDLVFMTSWLAADDPEPLDQLSSDNG